MSSETRKQRSKILIVLVFIAGGIATYVLNASLDSLRDYLLTSKTDLSTLIALLPISTVVILATFAIFVARYYVIPAKDGLLRRFPPRRDLLAYYIELPIALILLSYCLPGIYGLAVNLATCPPRNAPSTICYWSIQANEWVIMIHLATIFAVGLVIDFSRYRLKARRH